MKFNNLIFTSILLLLAFWLTAQDVQFTVDAPNRVEHNAQFKITYTINQEGDFTGPQLTDFQVLGGPSVSSATSMQIINGRTSSSSTKSYTYFLRATKIGSFKVPMAKVVVKGKEYRTPTLGIEVLKSANGSANATQSEITNADFKPDGIVFVRSIIDKKKVYLGEPVLLTQKLYSKERIANISDFKEPNYGGFWKENIDIGELKQTTEVINGVSYNVVVLQRILLFPQKAGKLEIGSFTLEGIVQIIKKRRPRDQFEQMMYGNVIQYYDNQEITLNSPKEHLQVSDFPANKPNAFSGITGNFKMETHIDKTTLNANDAFNLKITISGNGNFELLPDLDIAFPPDFEVYDPKISKKIQTNTDGISGSKTIEYLIIPRQEGSFTIPSFGFNFFNPQTEHYESCYSKDLEINVNKGDGTVAMVSQSGANKTDVKYLGQDIRHISTTAQHFNNLDHHYFNSWEHWAFLLLSPLLTLALVIFGKKQQDKRGNKSYMRHKKATSTANKKLKKANEFLKNHDKNSFYTEVSRAIWGYLADKFSLSISELNMENIESQFSKLNIEAGVFAKTKEVLENCEFARYAPGDEVSNMHLLYDSALMLISQIEKSIK